MKLACKLYYKYTQKSLLMQLVELPQDAQRISVAGEKSEG